MNRIDELRAIIYWLSDSLEAAKDELSQLEGSEPPVILTSELIHSAGTAGKAWNNKQLAILGVTDKRKGWLARLCGTSVSKATWNAFVNAGKSATQTTPPLA